MVETSKIYPGHRIFCRGNPGLLGHILIIRVRKNDELVNVLVDTLAPSNAKTLKSRGWKTDLSFLCFGLFSGFFALSFCECMFGQNWTLCSPGALQQAGRFRICEFVYTYKVGPY